MLVKNFYDLPQELQCEEVRPYFEILNQRRTSLLCKSIFDRVIAAGMLIVLSPVFLVDRKSFLLTFGNNPFKCFNDILHFFIR